MDGFSNLLNKIISDESDSNIEDLKALVEDGAQPEISNIYQEFTEAHDAKKQALKEFEDAKSQLITASNGLKETAIFKSVNAVVAKTILDSASQDTPAVNDLEDAPAVNDLEDAPAVNVIEDNADVVVATLCAFLNGANADQCIDIAKIIIKSKSSRQSSSGDKDDNLEKLSQLACVASIAGATAIYNNSNFTGLIEPNKQSSATKAPDSAAKDKVNSTENLELKESLKKGGVESSKANAIADEVQRVRDNNLTLDQVVAEYISKINESDIQKQKNTIASIAMFASYVSTLAGTPSEIAVAKVVSGVAKKLSPDKNNTAIFKVVQDFVKENIEDGTKVDEASKEASKTVEKLFSVSSEIELASNKFELSKKALNEAKDKLQEAYEEKLLRDSPAFRLNKDELEKQLKAKEQELEALKKQKDELEKIAKKSKNIYEGIAKVGGELGELAEKNPNESLDKVENEIKKLREDLELSDSSQQYLKSLEDLKKRRKIKDIFDEASRKLTDDSNITGVIESTKEELKKIDGYDQPPIKEPKPRRSSVFSRFFGCFRPQIDKEESKSSSDDFSDIRSEVDKINGSSSIETLTEELKTLSQSAKTKITSYKTLKDTKTADFKEKQGRFNSREDQVSDNVPVGVELGSLPVDPPVIAQKNAPPRIDVGAGPPQAGTPVADAVATATATAAGADGGAATVADADAGADGGAATVADADAEKQKEEHLTNQVSIGVITGLSALAIGGVAVGCASALGVGLIVAVPVVATVAVVAVAVAVANEGEIMEKKEGGEDENFIQKAVKTTNLVTQPFLETIGTINKGPTQNI